MVCHMPEPCKFPFLDSYQKRFLWTHEEVDFVPHPVVGLMLQVGDTEKFPHALGFESLDPFFQSQQAGFVLGDSVAFSIRPCSPYPLPRNAVPAIWKLCQPHASTMCPCTFVRVCVCMYVCVRE